MTDMMRDPVNRTLPWLLAALCATTSACSRGEEPAAPAAAAQDDVVRTLADAYLAATFDRFPEQATYYGVPGRAHDRLTDNSVEALRAWEVREDAWLAEARAIPPEAVTTPSLRAALAIVRETLESAVGARVCRFELWPVSQMTGWHVGYGYLVTIQPVGTEDARKEALARWGALPRYIDTEIGNLREGLRQKHLAPKGSVRIVIDQLDTLMTQASADTPFLSPVQRDESEEFRRAFRALVRDELTPAFRRYRDFLSREYLPAARDAIAVSSNPDGGRCYEAAVRQHSSLSVPARQIHDIGLQQIDRIMGEMKSIAERSFGTSDVKALLTTLRTDPRYLFKNRQELIAQSEAALARARAAAPGWFGLLPKADVKIEPYPAYREKNAPNEYNAPAEDGSRPALFYISAYEAEKRSRSGPEATAFHETIPGHHLQVAIALERREIHPIGRYIFSSGYVEGWALYSERLADEMKLYSSDLDRLGMLSNQALRAARLVVDSGMHTLGWSRQQAIDYMLAHTTEGPADVAAEIDRYIIWPGQATAYMLGMLEIERSRRDAEARLGSRFDIKAFHDRVLEDGGVPLTFLAAKIRNWIAAS
jgi:uncharacterized protein (DUF885 family)